VLSSLAYVLVEDLWRLGLAGTEWAKAQVDTIRLKLLKIAAQVRITVRRIRVRYSCAYPWHRVLVAAWTAMHKPSLLGDLFLSQRERCARLWYQTRSSHYEASSNPTSSLPTSTQKLAHLANVPN
jgi:hypothetical protein